MRLKVRAGWHSSFSWSNFTSAAQANLPEPATIDPTPALEDAEDAGEGEGTKLLSKKEKERLKKEKEKVNDISLCTT